MKTKELLKLLKKTGAYLDHQGANHDIWYSPKTGKYFPVPRHKGEIAPGTAKNIIKDAGAK